MGARRQPRAPHINVRVTGAERAEIMARSARYGIPLSTFMREAALHIDHQPVRVADAEELRAMRTDLKRLGNLLNQSVRLGHTYGLDDETVRRLEASVSNVSDAAARISKLLAQNTGGR